MSRALAAAALSALLVAVVPSAADAKTFRGKTSQGKGVRVVTGAGVFKRMVINWTADCRVGSDYRGSTLITPADTSVTADGAAVYSGYGSRLNNGYRSRIRTRLRAVPAGGGWRGTFRATVRITRNGRAVTTCRLAPVAFTAGAAAAPGPAKSFAGATAQSRAITLNTREDGVPVRVRVHWQAKCGDGDIFWTSTLYESFDAATPDAVHDQGSYRERNGTGKHRGERYRVFVTVDGKRTVRGATERWSGTVAVKVVVSKRGKVLTRCRLKPARWSAELT